MSRDVASYRLSAQITSQPAELARVLSDDQPVAEAVRLLLRAHRVFTIGTGTSSNAAATAGYMLRAAGIEATAWAAYDFALYGPALRPGDAAVVFSHSGRKHYTRDVLALLHTAKVPTIWIAGAEAEPNPADVILRTVPRETSAAFTVSHTSAMLLTARVADAIRPGAVGALGAVPEAASAAVESREPMGNLARDIYPFASLHATGAGPHEPSAHEVTIKVAEAARLRVRGFACEQFLHGPQVQVQPGDPLLVFAGTGPSLERSRTVAQFGLDVGMVVTWIGPVEGPHGSVTVPVRDVGEQLAPIIEIIPAQWLAAHLAALNDVDADSFRRDDAAFLAAYGRYAL